MGKRPWSKLQRDLYNLMNLESGFQIHCVGYRMPESQSSNPQIPRYWITVGKGEIQKIVWDWPSSMEDREQRFHPYLHVPAISALIREYINTPRQQLTSKAWEDPYGLVRILLQHDRRLG